MCDAGSRLMGRLFYWALVMMAASGFGLPASGFSGDKGVATTTVADTIYMADGSTASGSLIITWPAFVTADGSAVAAGTTSVTLGADGALSVALVPNAGATPAGVYYSVTYQLGPGQVKTETWIVPASSPANLAGVRATPGSGLAGQPVSMQFVNSALATKADDSAVVHLNGAETISGSRSGLEKKDAAMTFLQNAIGMTDAIASREIVQPEQFKNGISQIIDGVVLCMNASAWAKGAPSAPSANVP